MAELLVEIISPTGVVFQGNCNMAVVPALSGDIGVMKNHESFIARLQEGQIKVYKTANSDKFEEYNISGGFAEIDDSGKLLILID